MGAYGQMQSANDKQLRERALDFAVRSGDSASQVVSRAKAYLSFLSGGEEADVDNLDPTEQPDGSEVE